MFRPRPSQQKILAYRGGKMGISAVPGSGKTHTLAYLAAQIVATRLEDDDQEVLIVTLVNAAVNNFISRVNSFVQAQGLLPNIGYRVRTLHGLAHDIVRERPGLLGLAEDFIIVDERDARNILTDAVEAWVRSHPELADRYLADDLEGSRREWVQSSHWPDLVQGMAAAFIKRAKDMELDPDALHFRLGEAADELPLVRMGLDVYADYQRGLAYRGGVDFDDLIRLALMALRLDEDFLNRLRHRWPFVLEDEAQDSSELQEKILRLLTDHADGNWVRVGDPNQAIYDTFTNADPSFLRNFLQEPGVAKRTLPSSGRSQLAVVELANYLVDWTVTEHPKPEVRGAFLPQHIEPTPPGDPQPNPPENRRAIRLVARAHTPDAEIKAVADSVARWLPDNADKTVAVLVPRNRRGYQVIDALRARDVPYVELLQSTTSTRQAAGALGNVLAALAEPTSSTRLAAAFRVWRRRDRGDADAWARVKALSDRLRKVRDVERFLWPGVEDDPLGGLEPGQVTEAGEIETLSDLALLAEFRQTMRRWQAASMLPIDQLVLTLGQDLFHEPADLALAHKLAVVLRAAAHAHPDWRLPELTEELASVARNQRRFIGLASEDTGFDPERHKGEVVVATMHKAKGLEWDRVYLMSVNNYNFPSAQSHDTYIAERWFIRDRLNLEAEILVQLGSLLKDDVLPYREGKATHQARLDYVAERLRLFYVGITRARRDLVVTWNTGRPQVPQRPAVPFITLRAHWENEGRVGEQATS
ncbi:MAG: ATP-dependent helicase [Anaerolineae bacterium]|nr:MAG: ATP-dependent helicase [Anaerolineae bacterium]